MHCFIHTDKEAIGICQGCGKAICLTCLKDVQTGTACSETCAKDVKEFNEVIGKLKRFYNTGRSKNSFSTSRLFLVIGVVNAIVVTIVSVQRGNIDWGLIGFSAIFFVAAGFTYLRDRN